MLERCDDCHHVALMHTQQTKVGTYGCEQCACRAFISNGLVLVRDDAWHPPDP